VAVASKGTPGRTLRNLAVTAWQVLTAPTMGFFRLAESPDRLAPLLLAMVVGGLGSGMGSLKVLILIAATAVAGPSWFGWGVVLFLALAPFSYAATAGAFALVGWGLTAKQTGLSLREAFARCWSVLGWANLPLVLFMLVLAVIAKPVFGFSVIEMLSRAPIGVVPSTRIVLPSIVTVALIAWLALLLVVAIRQAFATSTWRAVAIIALTALLLGGLVHTPIAQWVVTVAVDEYGTFGPGRAVATVNLLSYRQGAGRQAVRGDLVAFTPTDRPAAGSLDFVVETSVGTIGAESEELYFGRVIGLPGDRVAVENGWVFVNGALLDESYLAHVTPSLAHPPGLDISEVRVDDDFLFILPDDRSLIGQLPNDNGPLINTSRVRGKVLALTRPYYPGQAPEPQDDVVPSAVEIEVAPVAEDPGVISPVWRASVLDPDTQWYAVDYLSGAALIDKEADSDMSRAVLLDSAGNITGWPEDVGEPLVLSSNEAGSALFQMVRAKFGPGNWSPSSHSAQLSWFDIGLESVREKTYGETTREQWLYTRISLSPEGEGLLVGPYAPRLHGGWLLRYIPAEGNAAEREFETLPNWDVDWANRRLLLASVRDENLALQCRRRDAVGPHLRPAQGRVREGVGCRT